MPIKIILEYHWSIIIWYFISLEACYVTFFICYFFSGSIIWCSFLLDYRFVNACGTATFNALGIAQDTSKVKVI